MKRTLVFTAILIFCMQIPSFAKINRQYDKYEDTTAIESEYTELKFKGGNLYSIDLEAGGVQVGWIAVFSGHKPKPAQLPELVFKKYTNSNGYKALQDVDEIFFLIDGKRVSLNNVEYNDDGIAEYLFVRVPKSTFDKIQKAKHIEGKMFRSQFSLDSGISAYAREMLKAMRK